MTPISRRRIILLLSLIFSLSACKKASETKVQTSSVGVPLLLDPDVTPQKEFIEGIDNAFSKIFTGWRYTSSQPITVNSTLNSYSVFLTTSSVGFHVGPFGMGFKRDLLKDPFKNLKSIPVEGGFKFPDYAMLDRVYVNLNFWGKATIPLPNTGFSFGLELGANGKLEILNLRTFSGQKQLEKYSNVSEDMTEWQNSVKIAQELSNAKTLEDDLASKNPAKLSRFQKLSNVFTFYGKMPFSKSNIEAMDIGDEFAYSATGYIMANFNIAEGLLLSNSVDLNVNIGNDFSKLNSAQLSAFLGARINVGGKIQGQWQTIMQKRSPNSMRVMLTEITDKQGEISGTLGGRLEVVLNGINSSKGSKAPYVFEANIVKLTIGKRKNSSFRRIYDYNLNENITNLSSKDVFNAYFHAANGDFLLSDSLIDKCEELGISDCPVKWIKNITTNESENYNERKFSIFVANYESKNKIILKDTSIEVKDFTIQHVSNVIETKYTKGQMSIGLKIKKLKSLNLPLPSILWRNKTESFFFAQDSKKVLNAEGALISSRNAVLTRWKYQDFNFSENDHTYLDTFFNKVLGQNNEYSKYVENLYYEYLRRKDNEDREYIPFDGRLQYSLLPKLLDECLELCKMGKIDPYLLLYKAFVFEPNSVNSLPMESPNLFDTFSMEMPLYAKLAFPSVLKELRMVIAEKDVQKRSELMNNMFKRTQVAPQLFAFLSYLTAATLNGNDSKTSLTQMFDNDEDSENSSIIEKATDDRVSLYFRVKSGKLTYRNSLNGKIYGDILEEIKNPVTEVVELE